MPDQYGRKTLDEAITAAYEVCYQAEQKARSSGCSLSDPEAPLSDLEAGAMLFGWIFGFLTGAGLVVVSLLAVGALR